MRGLAFPPNAPVDREASYEYGTPISNVDDIPIDPALSTTPIDPALMSQDDAVNITPEQAVPTAQPEPSDEQPQESPLDHYQIRQYSQGPQGDPFAPQIPTPFFPIEPEQPIQPHKPKRRRKVQREEECSFCQGNDGKNKRGEEEAMLTCHECGRSGHPTCMQLEKLGVDVRSYQWKCIECKNCEVCREKGDDERILFCDWCDRGWHMDCMQPPIQDPPEGEWHCPLCPPILLEDRSYPQLYQEHDDASLPPSGLSPMTLDRELSVASTSRSVIAAHSTFTKPKRNRKSTAKGKARLDAKAAAAIDRLAEDDVVFDPPPVVPRPRGRPPKNTKRRPPSPLISEVDIDEQPIIATRTPRRKRPREPSPASNPPTRIVRLRIPAQKGKGKEREEEESPRGLFDDFLNAEDRDVSKTTPLNIDKQFFERSRSAAEEKAMPPPPIMASSSRTVDNNELSISTSSRPTRAAVLQHQLSSKLLDTMSFSTPSTPGGAGGASVPPLPKFEPGVLRIRYIRFGPYDIKTWYDAPFPEEYSSIPDGRLWICEFCLKYMKSHFKAVRHLTKCKMRHPPGDEIYRDGEISIFEVDGRRNKIYCQNLCLLSKMFLDHKSLFYDVEPFLFYVITQVDDFGARFVGYFSKEKRCPKDYNLSCIMTLPVRQRQGWGNLLIDFSYLLSKIEQRTGSPEKPLSSLGAIGYRNYWTLAVMRFLEKAGDNVRLEDISSATSMTIEDVCNTLIEQNMIFIRESTPPPVRPSPGQTIKFPKGRKNGVARKHLQRMQTQEKDADGNTRPFEPPKNYEIHFDRQKVEEYLRKWEAKGYLRLKPEKLQWTPYLVTRSEASLTVDLQANANKARESAAAEENTVAAVPEIPSPATPVQIKGMVIDSPGPVGNINDNELPMVVDEILSGSRTRTRTSTKSPTKSPSKLESTRSLRSNHDVSVPPPVTPAPPLRSLRSRSSNVNFPSPGILTPSTSTRSTRRGGKKQSKLDGENEEPAVTKSPIEDATPGRTLRSGRGDTQVVVEGKRPPVMARAPSIRKRRRIESSPETEEDETVPEESTVEPNGDAPSPMEVDSGSEPIKLYGHVNGHHPGLEIVRLEMQTPETTTAVEPSTATSAVEEETATKESVHKHEADVKSEDRGTPLMSLTSRQSVPSDDTVFITSEVNGGGKIFTDFGTVHQESDMRSTLTGILYSLEDCHDEDADGEYEEDAEGEPDSDYVIC